jgi:soluble lytic murein transglycosylase-like protein
VVGLIKDMAPKYGVPTWFALRIAKVESGYNPNTRGAAGEYGVYQMKCATARGHRVFRQLLRAAQCHTNIRVGLKHLQMAMKLSHGNLKLGGLKAQWRIGLQEAGSSLCRNDFLDCICSA